MFRSTCFMLFVMLSMLRSSLSYVFDVRSTCVHVSYHVFVPRSIFPMCCLARSTCLYACLHIYLSRSTCLLLYAMLSMLRSSFSYVLMFRSTCFHVSYHVFVPRSIFPMCCLARSTCFYALYMSICLSYMLYAFCYVFPCFVHLFVLCQCQGHMLTCLHVVLAIPCLDLCVYMCISTLYGQIVVFTCLYAWIHVLPCLCARLVHVGMYVSMPTCLDLCFHMLVCLGLLYMLYAISHVRSTCLRASCHVYVFRPRLCLSCHVLLQPFYSFCCIFLCFGLMVRTRFRPYGLCHHPYTKAHIKRVWIIPICMSMLACFYVLCLCWPLQFQALLCLAPSAGLILFGYI